jgi:glycosyltransferase involved in cell wall biosynthesis
MHVVVNCKSMLGAWTGIAHYTSELLESLTKQAGHDQIHAYPAGWIGRRLRARQGGSGLNPGKLKSLVGWVLGMPGVRGALRGWLEPMVACHFQSVCRRHRYDLYHEPNILPMPCDRPTIATLHDLSAIVHPEWHPIDRVKHFQRYLDRALGQCVHLITGSNFTRGEIIEQLGVAPSRVTCVYHGIRAGLHPLPPEEVATTLRQLGLPPTYLLHVGTLEPRKNLGMLMRAYVALPGALRERCPLLLVGKWGWNTSALAEYLHGEARHRGVMQVGYVAEEHLPALYNGARALVYPSLYEGFGLPPLEMMACGGAVLASTAGSVAEIVGPCAWLTDPLDEEGWREAMRRVILHDDWQRQLCRGVRQWVQPFTWERCAAQTLQTYRKVLGIPTVQPLAA